LPSGLTLTASTGLLTGTPTTVGTFTGNFTATNLEGSVTQAFSFTVNAVPFATWASGASLSGASLSGASLSGANAASTATPFNDGVSNLLKYAFNMNGAGPDVGILTPTGTAGLPLITATTSSSGQLVMTVTFLRRRGSALVYEAQESTTLVSFAPLGGAETTTVIDAAWERVRVVAPASTAPRRFFRVSVTP
jgi:hypothetical protein